MSEGNRQIESTAASWLARRDGVRWSADDQRAFDAWLDSSTAHRVAFLRLDAAWREAGRLKALAAIDDAGTVPKRGAWRRLPYFNLPAHAAGPGRDAKPSGRRRRWLLASAAALFAVVLASGTLLWRATQQVDRSVWTTAVGEQQLVHLADGSAATLSGDTELRVFLGRRERNVDLVRGEALFDVAKDHTRPFVVHASGYRVIAVGTRFDVRQDGNRLRVVVTRGLVRLQPANGNGQDATELPAGSIAQVSAAGVVVRHVSQALAADALSWRDGFADLHDTPLADAVAQFNRYNQRQITIADPALADLRVGGHFRLDNQAAFVRLLEQMFPIHAERQGQGIVLRQAAGTPAAP
ncbi:MAG: DUF4880 domain-containing protein [Rhodanobacteraceae bacterium]|nr:MAG: DUF4880 domain-containing protein [Rhodanobacteraceae bacterium]